MTAKWLAHAQGKFYLTSEKRLTEGASLPSFDSLTPGDSFDFPGAKKLVVAELGVIAKHSFARYQGNAVGVVQEP